MNSAAAKHRGNCRVRQSIPLHLDPFHIGRRAIIRTKKHYLLLSHCLELCSPVSFAFFCKIQEVVFLSLIHLFFRPLGPVVSISTASTTNLKLEPHRRNRLRPWALTKVSQLGGLFLFALACFALATSAFGQATIMSGSTTPTTVDGDDGQAVELGVKFKADTGGLIAGLRFYKASANKGTHVGHIWSTSGILLGSATFTSESKSGWQQVNFSSPIPVSANTVYVASYFAPQGHYSENVSYLAKAGIDSPPLHALADGVSGADGVYVYSSKGGFPTTGWSRPTIGWMLCTPHPRRRLRR